MDELVGLLLNGAQADLVVEETEPQLQGPFILKYRGVASIDYAISRNGNYYDRAFNDRMLEATLEYMNGGEVVSVFSRHGKAVQPDSLPTGLPVGHVIDVFREGNKIKYVTGIVDTAEGRDVAKLIQSKTIRATSIRLSSSDFEFEEVTMDGKKYRKAVRGRIKGIDLADEAGIKGAGIEAVLEEAPSNIEPFTGTTSEGGIMEWDKVTMKDLQEHCAGLLEEYKVSVLEANPPATNEEALTALTAERDQLKTRVGELEESTASAIEAAESNVAKLELEIALLESSQIGAGREIYAALKEKVTKKDEIAGVLEEVRSEALNKYISGRKQPGGGEVKPKGDAHPGGDEGNPLTEETGTRGKVASKTLSAEQLRMLDLAGFATRTTPAN